MCKLLDAAVLINQKRFYVLFRELRFLLGYETTAFGRLVIGEALAWDVVIGFLSAAFSGAERHSRRLLKVEALETDSHIN